MTKYIIRDFFSAFRINSLRQNKAARTCVYMTVYMICISLFGNRVWSGGLTAWRNAAVENALLLPMIFIYGSVMVHPVRLAKIMYLCPMSPKERRTYICGLYCFRIGVHMLAAIAGLCFVVAYSYCDMISAMQILINYMLSAVLVNHRQETDKKVMVIGEIIFVAAMLSNAMQFAIVLDIVPHPLVRWCLFWIFCFVQLPLEIWYVKYIRSALRTAVYYDGSELPRSSTERYQI